MKRFLLSAAVLAITSTVFAQPQAKKVTDVAKFEKETIDFGKIKQSVPATHNFDFTNIDTYQPTLLDYEFMDEIFYDILFNNSVLPTKFYYNRSPYGIIPFYIKYLFNANNYVTSMSIGSSINFNQATNERIQIKYH